MRIKTLTNIYIRILNRNSLIEYNFAENLAQITREKRIAIVFERRIRSEETTTKNHDCGRRRLPQRVVHGVQFKIVRNIRDKNNRMNEFEDFFS